jgi:hypothetical protein
LSCRLSMQANLKWLSDISKLGFRGFCPDTWTACCSMLQPGIIKLSCCLSRYSLAILPRPSPLGNFHLNDSDAQNGKSFERWRFKKIGHHMAPRNPLAIIVLLKRLFGG